MPRPAITEGMVSKGGRNPPNTSDARPPAPGGSGGKQRDLVFAKAVVEEIVLLLRPFSKEARERIFCMANAALERADR